MTLVNIRPWTTKAIKPNIENRIIIIIIIIIIIMITIIIKDTRYSA